MEIALARIQLPKEPAQLITLPPPVPPANPRKAVRQLKRTATHFLERWNWILCNPSLFDSTSLDSKCPKCGKITQYSGKKLWYRLMLIAASYYESAVREIIKQSFDEQTGLPPGLNLSDIGRVVPRDPSLPTDEAAARALQVDFRHALIAAFFIVPMKRISSSNMPTAVFEDVAHSALARIRHWQKSSPNADMRRLAGFLSDGLIEILAGAYEERNVTWNKEHRSGAFSSIRLPELALLARREVSICKRYGHKHVEAVFEQQLALILQSLGFLVIRTRRGERTVDLFCISADPAQPMSILVEAKTTGNAYSLPTADQRALLEYSKSVRANLTTLPPLAFVLIIAPDTSPTIEKRLATLEADTGAPVRLMLASHLAELRESMPGPLRIATFRRIVLESSSRRLPALASILLAESETISKAHEAVVRACLPATQRLLPAPTQWDHDSPGSSAGTSS
ncbi:MAG TPA: hypothetical protein VGD63_02410 [Steroidobacteraceae bacterium]